MVAGFGVRKCSQDGSIDETEAALAPNAFAPDAGVVGIGPTRMETKAAKQSPA
jgi:hypothetical protein